MYGSIDDVVLDLAMEPNQDARALYVSIEALFQANKESRAVVLEQEFHSLSQGDLSVDAYAQQMKRTADALREVGHTVSPAQLVLNLLRGLNPRFANCRCSNPSTSMGGTRSKVEGGDRHDLEPEGTREDTSHEIYTGSDKPE
jgi:hypothetical protein